MTPPDTYAPAVEAMIARPRPFKHTALTEAADTLVTAYEAEKARADEATRERDAARDALAKAEGERDAARAKTVVSDGEILDEYQSLQEDYAGVRETLTQAVEALEIIVGERQCIDNLMGNRDVAFAALTAIRRARKEPKT